jgi:N-acetylglucosaminyldiphosphoundecaprenol N-acetyl-beta-D-mannosaminyltransferase
MTAMQAYKINPSHMTQQFIERRSAPRRRGEICDVVFDFLDGDAVLQILLAWRSTERREYVSLVNPHSAMLCRRDFEMRRAIQRSAVTLPDGVGIVLGARLLDYGKHPKLPGPELMLHLCDRGREHNLRHYFFGGGDGIAGRLAGNLSRRFPGLAIAGCRTPPFAEISGDENARMVEEINAAKPDIVWIGLGAPKQEKWMARQVGRIEAPAMIGVGAAFDFHSGNRPWCPEPVRRMGLEWAYRLSCEPRRLWRRNLDSFRFLAAIAGPALAQKTSAGYSPALKRTRV